MYVTELNDCGDGAMPDLATVSTPQERILAEHVDISLCLQDVNNN